MSDLLDLGGYVVAQLQRERLEVTTFGLDEPLYLGGAATGVRLFCGLGMLDLSAEQIQRLAEFLRDAR